MCQLDSLKEDAVDLLRNLISTPSFSGREDGTATLISNYLNTRSIDHIRKNNNILVGFDQVKSDRPTCLLNSHHDTVKVVNGWTKDPFAAASVDGALFGLGSNDAGASLVSLIATYIHLQDRDLPFNLVLAATAEEENFGPLGVKSLVAHDLSIVDFGIVGEPTNMEVAIAEKGLIVIDGLASGAAGHAARKEGVNAIYKAIQDIQKIADYQFDKVSPTLGSNIMSVTQVGAGVQHNVVPDACNFVIDLRVNDCYTLEEAFAELVELCDSHLTARSFNNRSSGIASDHPLVLAGKSLGLKLFGSATLSDQANMAFPTVKMGPGYSERSHTPDEYILEEEIRQGIEGYVRFLEAIRI